VMRTCQPSGFRYFASTARAMLSLGGI
jgi:hypothetical protein